ncbi:MAG: ribonuclease III domain-containing protein [Clostridia bacterium]|nr:ribonuclease III domain-containing protein [Clostridia bacterium]
MERFFKDNKVNPDELSPLTLAFIGDTVFDLIVREELICQANRPANDLHTLAVKKVKASAQAEFIETLMPYLNEKETAVYRRGRNAKPGHLPKNSNPRDYHMATGFEALIGYLYLSNKLDRIMELYTILNENKGV